MISDAQLIQRARELLNPWRLSPSASSGTVASALVTELGKVYVGVCIDTGSSMGFCAEHNAIGTMITHGENRIATIVAVHQDGRILAPCGRCREFISQIHPENKGARVLLSGNRAKQLAELLPEN